MPDYSAILAPHLKATDVPPNREISLTIVGADVQQFSKFGAEPNEPKKPKLVLRVAETPRTIVCNRTNAAILAASFGPTTEALVGKKIMVSQCATNLGPAIKISVPAQPAGTGSGDPFARSAPPAPAATPPIDPTTVGDLDDDIPF